jgi:GT2 family glycosyltransferase
LREEVNIMFGVIGYGSINQIDNCLKSINREKKIEDLVVIIQNGILYKNSLQKKYPEIIIINGNKNIGPAKGRNILISYFLYKTDCSHLFFIDYDTTLISGCIDNLLIDLSTDIGIVGATLKYPDGTVLSTGIDINKQYEPVYHRDILNVTQERDIVMTTAAIVSRQVFEKGVQFNPDYFAYWEDADFSIKIKDKGYKNIVCCDAIAIHPLKKKKFEKHISYYMMRNRLFFLKNNYNLDDINLAFIGLKDGLKILSIKNLLIRETFKKLFFSFLGLFDFLRRRMGKSSRMSNE